METGANKILPKVNVSPSSLDNLLTEKCHLSVEIGLNNFSYCLFDTLTFTYILLKKFEFQAKDIKESCEKITNIISKKKQGINKLIQEIDTSTIVNNLIST